MSDPNRTHVARARYGPIRSSLIALTSFLRALPLFFRASPRTPLRVLAIVALDTVHVFRNAKPLTRKQTQDLGLLLDFLACTNAALDDKDFRVAEYQTLGDRLDKAGLQELAGEYLIRIRNLEGRRPQPGGDRRRFDEVRLYRESVVRLSLGTVAAVALYAGDLDKAIESTDCDGDLATLTRLALLCQIIDDVMDYTEDVSAGLPSFLTATASLPEALGLTAEATRSYAPNLEGRSSSVEFPLRVAPRLFRITATVAVRVASKQLAWPALRSESAPPASAVPTAKP